MKQRKYKKLPNISAIPDASVQRPLDLIVDALQRGVEPDFKKFTAAIDSTSLSDKEISKRICDALLPRVTKGKGK